MSMLLGYWAIRGLAQPIRLLLEYTETPYTEKLYECGPAPTYSRECWTSEKESLGLDFPNLPYLIDGELKLTQSIAILRHIASKGDLCGKTDAERAYCDMVAMQSVDIGGAFTHLCYGADFAVKKDAYLTSTLPNHLKGLSQCLKGSWFAGENLTFADFLVYEYLDKILILQPSALDSFANLKDFHQRFESLPRIAAYMASPRFMRAPLNNKMASFGGQ